MSGAAKAASEGGDVAALERALDGGAGLDGLLHIAAEEGHEHIIDLLLRKGASLDEVDEDGQSPLHVAVANGHVEAAERLTRTQPCAQLDLSDKYKMSPLHLACEEGLPDMLALLLARGGDALMVEQRSKSNSPGTKSPANQRPPMLGGSPSRQEQSTE